ncbi:type II secretion system protein GspL [Sphingomonas alpina]|uniref:General secretion pathway protein GspL n=1 Tax=Sphingomonas alpina TaxID=653931 RepID=A0A7H0LMN6_9SPHN|nr:type II secretion system protein GspL [Sphingomonas alpina]QNQ10939.1 general secretion pathway protein GspL [Sphingomonas alpina]
MNDTLVLFLPAPSTPWRWLRIADDMVKARGEGFPEGVDPDGPPPVAIAPAESVTLHWAELPDRSAAQSVTAARMLAADASASPIADLHVAVGREDDHAERPIGVVSISQMHHWLAALAANGVDPAMLLPAPMLLPRPEEGYVRADLGGEGVVRGTTSGFADEARLTELVTGGAAPATLGRDELEAAIVAAVASPALDLRQGVFARRRKLALDWALIRRLGWLSVAILVVTLFIGIVSILKYSLAADALEQRADTLARQGLPRGETVNNADRQLDERLSRLRGGGLGFTRTAAAVSSAVRSVPGAELTALAFDANGDVRATISADREAAAADVRSRLVAQGFVVPAATFEAANGRVSGQLKVSPR